MGRLESLEWRRRAGARLVLSVCRHHLCPNQRSKLCGVSWGVLWFLFYLLLAAGRKELTKFTGTLCTLEGIYTGWVPGYLLLTGLMPGGPVPPH